MIRIRPDPDSKHCKDELNSHLEIIYTNVSDCLPEMLKEKKDKKNGFISRQGESCPRLYIDRLLFLEML